MLRNSKNKIAFVFIILMLILSGCKKNNNSGAGSVSADNNNANDIGNNTEEENDTDESFGELPEELSGHDYEYLKDEDSVIFNSGNNNSHEVLKTASVDDTNFTKKLKTGNQFVELNNVGCRMQISEDWEKLIDDHFPLRRTEYTIEQVAYFGRAMDSYDTTSILACASESDSNAVRNNISVDTVVNSFLYKDLAAKASEDGTTIFQSPQRMTFGDNEFVIFQYYTQVLSSNSVYSIAAISDNGTVYYFYFSHNAPEKHNELINTFADILKTFEFN